MKSDPRRTDQINQQLVTVVIFWSPSIKHSYEKNWS